MDGLNFQEINKSEIENGFTLGAEYYGGKYVEAIKKVESCASKKPLGKIWKLMTDGDHGSPDYQDSGVLYLLSESIEEGYINTTKCRYITAEKNKELKRSCLHPRDIVVTKTGVYFGKSAVIPETIPEANTIAHVGKITLKDQYNPYYVSTFLNSKYGYYQLRRRGIKATRPEIKLIEFPEILIPLFSKSFDIKIEQIIHRGISVINDSLAQIQTCEELLMSALKLDFSLINKQSSPCISKRSIKESLYSSGRLDAEYYQPKYDQLFDKLSNYSTQKLGGTTGIVKIKKSIEPGSNAYCDAGIPFARVSDVTRFGISNPEIHLPMNIVSAPAELYPKKNTILFSKDGSVGIAYKMEKDAEMITSGALLHLTVKNPEEVLPDYLTLVLNSPVVRLQAERDSNGSIIQHWKPSEIEDVVIPVLDIDIQKEISQKVQESFALRRKSEQLLEYAKHAVEIAIEQCEDVAMKWLESKVSE